MYDDAHISEHSIEIWLTGLRIALSYIFCLKYLLLVYVKVDWISNVWSIPSDILLHEFNRVYISHQLSHELQWILSRDFLLRFSMFSSNLQGTIDIEISQLTITIKTQPYSKTYLIASFRG